MLHAKGDNGRFALPRHRNCRLSILIVFGQDEDLHIECLHGPASNHVSNSKMLRSLGPDLGNHASAG